MRRVLLPALVAMAVTACGGATAGEDPLVPALCEALATEDVAAATEVFESRVHRPLHALADDLQDVDRSVAARLLEAKYDVETVVRSDDPGPAPLVQERLQVLLDQVRQGLAALDRPAPSC